MTRVQKSGGAHRRHGEPATQNIPVHTELGMEIRRAFILVSVDHQPASVDYSQIELRLLAHIAKEEGQ